ncbi:MAG: DMT family transporter [Syntrophomonadaceae bacterium]|jgi:drug/metabolite transporter (DMT)-like permease
MRLTYVYLALLLSILCMSTSSIIIRLCTAPALIISFYRVAFTSLIGFSIGGRPSLKGIKQLSRRDLVLTLGSGVFLALHLGFWITSLGFTSVSSSVLFTNLQVIFVLIFSALFLKEKVNSWVTGGILTALAGSILIVQGDLQSGRLLGDMLALLSGFFVAVYFLIGREVRARVDVWTYTSLAAVAAAVILVPVCKTAGLDFIGYPRLDWLWFFLQALGPGIGGHALLNWALKYLKAPVVSVTVLGESVGASILAFVIFHEYLLWYQIIGGMFILAGIYIAAVKENK